MKATRDIKRKINYYKNNAKNNQGYEMVSAAKFRRAQDAFNSTIGYAR